MFTRAESLPQRTLLECYVLAFLLWNIGFQQFRPNFHIESRTDLIEDLSDRKDLMNVDQPARAESPDVVQGAAVVEEHVDIAQYTGLPTASLVLPKPAPAEASSEGTLVNLTASLADGAPLFTESAVVPKAFDSSTSIARLSLLEKAVEFKQNSMPSCCFGIPYPNAHWIRAPHPWMDCRTCVLHVEHISIGR